MLLTAQQESSAALTRWAVDHGVDRADLERVYRGLRADDPTRAHAGHLQNPAVFVPGLESSPWHDPARFPWVAALEAEYPRIRAEFENQYSGTGLNAHPESTELAESGRWSTYHFYSMGEAYPQHLADCPATADALAEVPGVDSAGMCYFSVMGAKTKVKPHCGFLNTRIRCHLGLVVPPDCRMRVGTETRSWAEGTCLVFDDSFEHEVSNMSNHGRTVLLLDTWHPDLSEVERRAMAFLMGMWTSHAD